MAICAANDCVWKDVPVDEYSSPIFPRDVLIEWGSNRLFTIPHLLLASEADIDNPLLQYQTRSLPKLRRYFTTYQNVMIYYANWIRNAVRSSINHGFLSETNWGAVWGFRKDEFLGMVAPGVFDLARAREEGRVRQATHDLSLSPIRGDALILHPQERREAQEDYSTRYDPTDPYFDIDLCIPRPYQSTDLEEMHPVLAFGNQGYHLQA